jgi:hypothetical protein
LSDPDLTYIRNGDKNVLPPFENLHKNPKIGTKLFYVFAKEEW